MVNVHAKQDRAFFIFARIFSSRIYHRRSTNVDCALFYGQALHEYKGSTDEISEGDTPRTYLNHLKIQTNL